MTLEPKHVLIAGAGVAGPAVALLLSRAGHKCTIVERAPSFRTSGQQIDVSGEALKVIKIMEVEDEMRKRKVNDDGIKFVEANNKTIAAFSVDSSAGLVKDLEILRPDLALVIYQATEGRVEYIFDDYITTITQDDSTATVAFANSKQERSFDLIVAADGLRSRTRQIGFDKSNTEILSLKQYAGYFDIPWQASDGSWSRWYNDVGGRCVVLRPNITKNITGAYLCQVTEDSSYVALLSHDEQVAEMIKRFNHVGWETRRILKALQQDSSTFYLQEIAQSKSTSLANGRVALLGDAGYCPSPVSGQGTSIALIGAYILAGCIASHSDHRQALDQYEKQMRPFVESAQKLPPGVPWIVNPQSSVGISIMKYLLWIVGLAVSSSIATVFSKVTQMLPSLGSKRPTLPDYPALR